jgi:hypothetical protein
MPFSLLHRQVAGIALGVATRYGFVLGGGNALIVYGLIERQTADLDLVSDHVDGVKAAAGAIEEALWAAGFAAEPQKKDGGLGDLFYGFDMGLAEWIVTSPGGEQMILQIAQFDRSQAPVIMNVGEAQELPVLALEDLLDPAGLFGGTPRRFLSSGALVVHDLLCGRLAPRVAPCLAAEWCGHVDAAAALARCSRAHGEDGAFVVPAGEPGDADPR